MSLEKCSQTPPWLHPRPVRAKRSRREKFHWLQSWRPMRPRRLRRGRQPLIKTCCRLRSSSRAWPRDVAIIVIFLARRRPRKERASSRASALSSIKNEGARRVIMLMVLEQIIWPTHSILKATCKSGTSKQVARTRRTTRSSCWRSHSASSASPSVKYWNTSSPAATKVRTRSIKKLRKNSWR